MSPTIVKRLVSIPGCNYYDPYSGVCYDSNWNNWGRWVLAGAVVLFFFCLCCCCALISARRRRNVQQEPFYGTAWMAPPKYSESQAQYNHYQPGPPVYGQAQNSYYGPNYPQQQTYYPDRNNTFSPPPGPPPGHQQSYEMQSQQQTGVVGGPSTYGGVTAPEAAHKNPLSGIMGRFRKN